MNPVIGHKGDLPPNDMVLIQTFDIPECIGRTMSGELSHPEIYRLSNCRKYSDIRIIPDYPATWETLKIVSATVNMGRLSCKVASVGSASKVHVYGKLILNQP